MKRNGFTIIELMVTISIIGILLAATGIGIARARKTGRNTQRMTDVLAYSQAIDQYASQHRGVYPKLAGNSNLGCASKLAEDNSLATSVFKGTGANTYPLDPLAASGNSSCTNYLDGYTYHVRPDALVYGSSNQYEYALEVGLEKIYGGDEKPTDEQQFTKGTEDANSGRVQYILYGKSCGTGHTTNTCSSL